MEGVSAQEGESEGHAEVGQITIPYETPALRAALKCTDSIELVDKQQLTAPESPPL